MKAVTPAVVNIAVTGGGEDVAKGRRQLPPGGPFGGPPPGPGGGDEPPGMEPLVDLVGLPVAARIGRSKVRVPASSSIPLGTS